MTDVMAKGLFYAAAIQELDFARIQNHDAAAIAQLHAVIARLAEEPVDTVVKQPRAESAAKVASGNNKDPRQRAEQVERQADILAVLKTEGFGDRMGKVYNSLISERVMPFKKVPHRQGLAAFDMVVAPDFSPSAGVHAIFISGSEVFSALLVSPINDNAWKLLKRKSYKGTAEMIDIVTMLSAGFDLP